MRERVTLADVAKAAGVHPGTVSRSLNEETEKQVNQETVRKIRKIAKKLGYTPNTVARGLRTRKSMTIGVILPDLTNPIFPPIVRGIDSYLLPRGYSVLVVNTDGDPSLEKKLFDSLMERQVDGFIIATGRSDTASIAEYHDHGIKAVLVNRDVAGIPFPAVTADDATGIRLAIEHLASLGHKKFLHLSGPAGFSTSRIRSKAFTDNCKKLGLHARIIKTTAYSVEAGQSAMDKYLDLHPQDATAVVAGNDLLALGVYHSLRLRGLRCPEDVSVVGFNNMSFANDFQPPMTTVHAPYFEMGVEAARLILSQIEGIEIGPMKITLPVSLVVRGSTARSA
ncbi:MAG TPA: LacI family DNA-binding transcriptional regulator [Candidatus Nanopelagicaceae bacterium]